MYRPEIYESADGFRWRMFAENGRNVGNGSEAYASEFNALRAQRDFLVNAADLAFALYGYRAGDDEVDLPPA